MSFLNLLAWTGQLDRGKDVDPSEYVLQMTFICSALKLISDIIAK